MPESLEQALWCEFLEQKLDISNAGAGHEDAIKWTEICSAVFSVLNAQYQVGQFELVEALLRAVCNIRMFLQRDYLSSEAA